jgi:long-chain acyl-CoA synthetase
VTAQLRFGDAVIADLDARAARLAGALDAAGVGEDDVAAIFLRNEPAYLEAMLACRQLGAYHCPVNWHFKADEAGFILRDSGAKVLLTRDDLLQQAGGGFPFLKVVTEVARWRDAHAPWQGAPRQPRGNMPYTSGTTGRPKGVRRKVATEAERKLVTDLYKTVLGVRPGMRALISAPLYHSAPNLYVMQAAMNGELVVLEPRFDAERTLALIEEHRIDNVYLVPTMYVRLLRLAPEVRRRYDLSSVRFVSSTGSPCAPEVKKAMIDWWGPVITETYASSETGHVTFIDSHDWAKRPGSVGRALPQTAIRILDDAGREVPAGMVGTIYVRQPAYPDFTYANNPEARAALEKDGLWAVGDMGYLDADGYLYIADRKSDMVISGGVNIYPAEIEAVLMTMPGVADCAVFGIPDAEFGEGLAAAIQMQPGREASAQAVQSWLKERISSYKVPKVVTFHEALPREDSGKIFKRRLREPYWRDAGRKI